MNDYKKGYKTNDFSSVLLHFTYDIFKTHEQNLIKNIEILSPSFLKFINAEDNYTCPVSVIWSLGTTLC